MDNVVVDWHFHISKETIWLKSKKIKESLKSFRHGYNGSIGEDTLNIYKLNL
jgi:hypothetical protein